MKLFGFAPTRTIRALWMLREGQSSAPRSRSNVSRTEATRAAAGPDANAPTAGATTITLKGSRRTQPSYAPRLYEGDGLWNANQALRNLRPMSVR